MTRQDKVRNYQTLISDTLFDYHWLPYWKCIANKHWKTANGRLISSIVQRPLRGTSNMGMYEQIILTLTASEMMS